MARAAATTVIGIPFLMAVLLPSGNGAALETDRLDYRVSAFDPVRASALLDRQATLVHISCQGYYEYVILIT